MASLKDLRNKIKSIKSIQQVTNAMKMVAAAKLRKSQEKMENARPYTNSIEEMINHLIPDIDRSSLSILESRQIKKKLFLVILAKLFREEKVLLTFINLLPENFFVFLFITDLIAPFLKASSINL